jgi:hypothetical protein
MLLSVRGCSESGVVQPTTGKTLNGSATHQLEAKW